jgi:predicted phosphodiesterase
MVARKVDDNEILGAWEQTPSSTELAVRLGIAKRTMDSRIAKLRAKGYPLVAKDRRSPYFREGEVHRHREEYSPRLAVNVENGTVLIGSDAHYIPGYQSTAQKAFVKFCREMKPKAVVMNGDLFDGASVSRWPRIGWEQRPTVKQELGAVTERLAEIEDAVGAAAKVWTLGNHDARYELRLAQAAPEYEGVAGFTLKEHFPLWRPCWSIWVNDSVVIKHRFKSGVHAAYTSTVHAGKTLVHGHLHSLKVYPFTDYNGTRFGCDAGTLADAYGGAFEGYMEDNARSWRSGFLVLTFHENKLLWPEVVSVFDENKVEFRGKVYSV